MTARNIPSLDGLRALSIFAVLLSHSNRPLSLKIPAIPGGIYVFWGASGVQLFFIISGFLITHLLLKELNVTKTIRLGRFYFRRAFRIFPPFYVYLVVAGVITLLGVFPGNLRAFIVAATYTWNYLGNGSAILEHTWSLSLEEQFYLLWPAALALLGKKKSALLATLLIVFSPPLRIAFYFLTPNHRAQLGGMLHTAVDSIMFGCLMALLCPDEKWRRRFEPFLRGWVAWLAGLFVIIVSPLIELHFRGSYQLVFGITLTDLCLSLILLYSIYTIDSPFAWLLNTPAMRHVGIISYSLYLWQRIFTRFNSVPYFPWNFLAVVICAEVSFWCVEQPSLRLRDRLRVRPTES